MALNLIPVGVTFQAIDRFSSPVRRIALTMISFQGITRGLANTISQVFVVNTKIATATVKGFAQSLILLQAGFVGLTLGFKAAQASAGLEESLAKVQVFSRATSEELARLKIAAIDASLDTRFSSQEAAEGLKKFAIAGLSATEAVKALGPALRFAIASSGDISIEDSVKLSVTVIKAFGDSINGLEDGLNQLFRTTRTSQLGFKDLSDGMSKLAGAANLMNASLSDTFIALGLVRDVVGQTSLASTGLSRLLNLLSRPKVGKSLKERFNIDVFDSLGKARPFLTVVNEIAEALSKLTTQGRSIAINEIFPSKKSFKVITALFQRLEKEAKLAGGGTEGFAKSLVLLRRRTSEANGTIKEAADLIQSKFNERLKVLKSSFESLLSSLGEGFLPIMTAFINVLIRLVNALTRLSVATPVAVKELLALATVAASIALVFAGANKAINTFILLKSGIGSLSSEILSKGDGPPGKLLADSLAASKKAAGLDNTLFDLKKSIFGTSSTLFGRIPEAASNAFSRVSGIVTRSGKGIVKGVGDVARRVSKVAMGLGADFDKGIGLLTAENLKGIGSSIKDNAVLLKQNFTSGFVRNFEKLPPLTRTALTDVGDVIKTFGKDVKAGFPDIKKLVSKSFENLKGAVSDALGSMKKVVSNEGGLIKRIVSKNFGSIPSDTSVRLRELRANSSLAFARMKLDISDKTSKIKLGTIKNFANMKERSLKLLGGIKDGGIKIFDGIKLFAMDSSSSMKDFVARNFADTKKRSLKLFGELKTGGIRIFSGIKTDTIRAASSMKDFVVGNFGSMATRASDSLFRFKFSSISLFNSMKTSVVEEASIMKGAVVRIYTRLAVAISARLTAIKLSTTATFISIKESMTGRLNDVLNNSGKLGGRISKALKSSTDSSGELLGKFTGRVSGAFKGLGARVSKSLGGIGTRLGKILGPVSTTIGKTAGGIGGKVLGLFGKIGPKIAGVFSTGIGASISGALGGIGTTIAGFFGSIVAATGVIPIIIAAVVALVLAWKNNFGGLKDFVVGVFGKVKLVFQALFQLFSSGTLSVGISKELTKAKNSSLLEFVRAVFAFGTQVKNFFLGMFRGIKTVFAATSELIKPTFTELGKLFNELFDIFFDVAAAIFNISGRGKEANSQMERFGAIVGALISGPIAGFIVAVADIAFGFIKVARVIIAFIRPVVNFLIGTFNVIVGLVQSLIALLFNLFDPKNLNDKALARSLAKVINPFIDFLNVLIKIKLGLQSLFTGVDLKKRLKADLIARVKPSEAAFLSKNDKAILNFQERNDISKLRPPSFRNVSGSSTVNNKSISTTTVSSSSPVQDSAGKRAERERLAQAIAEAINSGNNNRQANISLQGDVNIDGVKVGETLLKNMELQQKRRGVIRQRLSGAK